MTTVYADIPSPSIASTVAMRRGGLYHPADLISELIDNSLEFNATRIRVVLDRAASELTVTDNGQGNANIMAFFEPTRHEPNARAKFQQGVYGIGCFDAMVTFGDQSTVISSDGTILRTGTVVDWSSSQIKIQVGDWPTSTFLVGKYGLLGPTGTKVVCERLRESDWKGRATPTKMIRTLTSRFWPAAQHGVEIALRLDESRGGKTVTARVQQPEIIWSHGFPRDEPVSLADGRVIRVIYGLTDAIASVFDAGAHIVRGNARVIVPDWTQPTGAVSRFLAIIYVDSADFQPDVHKKALRDEDLDAISDVLTPLFEPFVIDEAARGEWQEVQEVESHIEEVVNSVFKQAIRATRNPNENHEEPHISPGTGPRRVRTNRPTTDPGHRVSNDAQRELRRLSGFKVKFEHAGIERAPLKVDLRSRPAMVIWNRDHGFVDRLYEKSRRDPEHGALATWTAALAKLQDEGPDTQQRLLPGFSSAFEQLSTWIRSVSPTVAVTA